ncbi:MAG: squalene--hopene cyclase [Phycisphaera sp.]|nr:squalene--hopene cyclase [Phycisphaera sp.]
MPIDRETFEETRRNAIAHLLDQREPAGHWVGELSSSALATATAITALSLVDRASGDAAHREMIARGAAWLIDQQNRDGGWGDTDRSLSNISTTMLCWGALGLDEVRDAVAEDPTRPDLPLLDTVPRCEQWLTDHAGSMKIPALVDAVMRRYGKDRTFSVPILTMCTLCGRLGDPDDGGTWRWVKQLPFELAALPQSFYRFVRLPVVSYALPALIAIGQVRHHHRPTWNPITRLARLITKRRTLRVLESIQPPNGGFLEATPLTSFVTMSLAACGRHDTTVAQRGVRFIEKSMRKDGSWPIDTDLSTWVTTLSINALAAGGKLDEYLNDDERIYLRDWLLGQQYTERHPYTGAAPGGWAWTPEPGGVPDADDTSGAVLALSHLQPDLNSYEIAEWAMIRALYGSDLETLQDEPTALDAGAVWTHGLINRDGGVPTFCRGWGKLPFDRSSVDITAHYLRARRAIDYTNWPPLLRFIQSSQRTDGAWLPLWFGNQHRQAEENATYGTSRVLLVLANRSVADSLASWVTDPATLTQAAVRWMTDNQNTDGGWGAGEGTPSSIEETALAVEALAAVVNAGGADDADDTNDAGDARPCGASLNGVIGRGVAWLVEHTERGTHFEPAPIGFYFAKLWYYEKLYPVIWTVAALERVRVWMEQADGDEKMQIAK